MATSTVTPTLPIYPAPEAGTEISNIRPAWLIVNNATAPTEQIVTGLGFTNITYLVTTTETFYATPLLFPVGVDASAAQSLTWVRVGELPTPRVILTPTFAPNQLVFPAAQTEASSEASVVTQATTSPLSRATEVIAPATSLSAVNNASASGLSDGQGIAIGFGSAFLGAIVAILACFFFLRRKYGSYQSRRGNGFSHGRGVSTTKMSHISSFKLPATDTIVVPVASATAIMHTHLPQPTDDNDLVQEFRTLKTVITGHIQNYYQFDTVSTAATYRALAFALQPSLNSSEQKVSMLMGSTKARILLLRAALGNTIMQRVLPVDFSTDTFLPRETSEQYALLSDSTNKDPTRTILLSKWRSLTAALLPDAYKQSRFAADDSRLESVRSAVRQADLFLAPCAQSKAADQARLRNLEEIMKRGARLAWLLFSQPALFAADWTGEQDVLVVYPGLIQLTDAEGQAMVPHKVLGQIKEIARV